MNASHVERATIQMGTLPFSFLLSLTRMLRISTSPNPAPLPSYTAVAAKLLE
jgi:hypothetical protein